LSLAVRLWSDEIEAMRAEARAVVAAGNAFMTVEVLPGTPSRDERVAAARASIDANTYPVPEAEERVIGGVACRVHRPDVDPRAIYLHFHGGGMISGAASLMDIPNQMLAREHSVAVVSVEYRKAPEFPWPAGPDDGEAVARALLGGVAAELGSERLLIGGESAGGYMAAAVALRIRELGAIDRVAGLNLTYGVHDWGGNPSQRGVRPTAGPDVLSPEFMELARECFVPGMTTDERRAPEISPASADLRGLPPCFVAAGTSDHLFDDSLALATRAAAVGVDVELFVLPELPHAFQVFDCGITRAWAAAQSKWMAAHIG
jgi:acetyl esterase/lipase